MNPLRSLAAIALLYAFNPVSLFAADASYFGVVKSSRYEQALAGSPTALASNAYAFNAFVVASTNFAVTNATFKAPNVSTNRTLILDTNGFSLQFEQQFQTSSALDSAYPSSASIFSPSVYAFTMRTLNDGVRSGNASYVFSSSPPTPQIANLSEGQNIDTTTSLTLRWSAMGGLGGIVQLLILDPGSNAVYSSPAPFAPDGLTASSSSGVIPPNALPTGTNLIGHLVFAQPGLPDTNSYAGALGVAALAKDTSFPLTTRPAPIRPILRVAASNAAPFKLSYVGETNRNYHLQAATNVDNAIWVDLLVTNAPAATFTDTQSSTLPRRVYRVQVGP